MSVSYTHLQFITITIGRCCLEYFDQLLVLAPVMEERIKKRHYDGVGFLDALLVILPKANLKQILQEFRSILSWGFYFTLLQLDEQLVDLYYKRCEEAVGFLVKRDADGYCRCIQQVYMPVSYTHLSLSTSYASFTSLNDSSAPGSLLTSG